MVVRTLPGFTIEVDTSDQLGWGLARAGIYEPLVTEAMWRLAEPSDLALDVGANIGYFAGLLSGRVAQTIAVEAHPDIGRQLVINAWRWDAVTVVRAAVSDRVGTGRLRLPDGFDANHGLASLEADVSGTSAIDVPTVTIDDLIGDRAVGVMKIDIEGHELTALRGAERAIGEGRIRDIFFEEHDHLPSAVSSLLDDAGYSVFSLAEHGRGVALGPIDAPPPRWYAPTYLATLEPDRARRLVRPDGWHSLRPAACWRPGSRIGCLSAGRAGAPIAVFSTLGTGSREEERIAGLTADLSRSVWPFDRRSKRRSAVELIRRVRRERPSLVVMEGTSIAGGAVVLLGRLLFGVPYVVSSGDAVGPFIRLIAPRLTIAGAIYEIVLCRCSAGFIAWTPYLAGRALTLGAPRAMTAANWAPTQDREPGDRQSVREELGIPLDAVVFGLVGSLNWTERVDYCYGLELVRAIRRTTRRDVHVLLVGDGDGRARLESEAGSDLGVRVHLVGRVPRQELGRYFAAVDVASLPQSVDGVGSFRYTTKLSEYLAAGLPVVTGQLPFAYDLGGDWLWRLPGDAPWTKPYVDALATLMTGLAGSEVQRRRTSVPRDLPIFDALLQRHRVTEFLGDLLDRVSAQARR
jgi:FkbM family methyltransferase